MLIYYIEVQTEQCQIYLIRILQDILFIYGNSY